MFPSSDRGPIWLSCWVRCNHQVFRAELVEADGYTRTAQVIQRGTLFEQTVSFESLDSVALCDGNYVLKAFGSPPAARVPEWVRFAEPEVMS